MTGKRSNRAGAALACLLVLSTACSTSSTAGTAAPRRTREAPTVAPAVGRPAAAHLALISDRRSVVFGRSVRGRALTAVFSGAPSAVRRILVVGVVHGNEAAGLPVAQRLAGTSVGVGTELVVVPDLNPDGVAAGTRQNARGVDLNRNFPYRWRRVGRRGDQQWTGLTVLSEPESQALVRLVRQVRPTVTVWFHQPVGVVDESGGDLGVERRFAQVLGEPLRRLTRYDGSGVSWENTTLRGTTAFVVELPRSVSLALERRAFAAVRDLER